MVMMPEYRRLRVPGGCYFFTVNLRDRDCALLIERIALLRECVRAARAVAPFHIDSWVVLPDHMHCMWTLPEGDDDFPSRWLAIKKQFSKAMPMTEIRSPVMRARRERAIWQRRYWEHRIRDADDYARHMDYVHFNPVKHGLIDHPANWPYSTFRRAVRDGFYPADWAPGAGRMEGEFGE
jgi:putative transposase